MPHSIKASTSRIATPHRNTQRQKSCIQRSEDTNAASNMSREIGLIARRPATIAVTQGRRVMPPSSQGGLGGLDAIVVHLGEQPIGRLECAVEPARRRCVRIRYDLVELARQ